MPSLSELASPSLDEVGTDGAHRAPRPPWPTPPTLPAPTPSRHLPSEFFIISIPSARRQRGPVTAGHETADLAGVLVQHFGSGMVEAVRALLGPDGEGVTTSLLVAVEQAVAHLDPDWDHHATQRWAARPARLVYA